MKLGIIVYSTDAETVWNAFRLGVFALKQGDQAKAFLLAKGVECEKLKRDMHLTLVATIYSIWLWKIIRGQFSNSKDVSRLRKLAVNILPSCVGRMAFAVLDASSDHSTCYGTRYTWRSNDFVNHNIL